VCSLQYFESDDPDLYTTKVQYIQENDVADLGLVFAEEEFDSNGRASTVSSVLKIKSQCHIIICTRLHMGFPVELRNLNDVPYSRKIW
jgi:hypothetical protein